MKSLMITTILLLTYSTFAQAKICKDFGPQTPRDISQTEGSNTRVFSFAPEYQQMNLCNIHFHKNAEHKGPGFSKFAGANKHGGYQCNGMDSLTAKELRPTKKTICKSLKPGDTIEVHWVHTSCATKPGKGLGSCLSAKCANPQLRVEAQVFLVVNDKKVTNFNDFKLARNKKNGYYQAKKIPNFDKPITFLGSTTGPSYTQAKCSPFQVTWSVRPTCNKVNIHSLRRWCKNNSFKEDHAHGVRQLVTDKRLLSPIK